MLSKDFFAELTEYIEENLLPVAAELTYSSSDLMQESYITNELEDFIQTKRKPTFQQLLFAFIDKKNKSDVEVYKKAGLDRRHFSKIRSNPDYLPKKTTVIALGIALELNHKKMEELLESAGYSLSDSDTFDLVIQFCMNKKIYDIDEVNQALDYFHLTPLSVVK